MYQLVTGFQTLTIIYNKKYFSDPVYIFIYVCICNETLQYLPYYM